MAMSRVDHVCRFTRRDFLELGAGLALCGIARNAAANAPGGVRFGVISDTHVAGPHSLPELARAFAFLRDKGVDAVLHCGDMTDFGYIDQLVALAETWRREMPPSVAFIPVLGNRDVSDTRRMSDAQRAADHDKLIRSAPAEHVRRILGLELEGGMRVHTVKGIPVVAMDWGKERQLEAFMMRHPELRDPSRPFIHIQHPHPGGTLGAPPCRDPAACWLNMFPRAIAISGHSHRPFTDEALFCHPPFSDFTVFGAGSHYLSGGPQQKGIREVSVLTVGAHGIQLERFGLHNGFHDVKTASFPPPPHMGTPVAGSFVFAQWNVGGFVLGQDGVQGGGTPARAEAFRRQLEGLGADILGLCEYDPAFAMGGSPVREGAFGGYEQRAEGPRLGLNGNTLLARRHLLRDVQICHFRKREQQRYCTICTGDVEGRQTAFAETHLDLDDACRKAQIAELLELCGKLPRVVLSGDLNISSLTELAPFAAAGFKATNSGRFGVFRTHRRRNTGYTTAIDNVLVKGFEILGTWTADDAMLLSDHRILACRLKPV